MTLTMMLAPGGMACVVIASIYVARNAILTMWRKAGGCLIERITVFMIRRHLMNFSIASMMMSAIHDYGNTSGRVGCSGLT